EESNVLKITHEKIANHMGTAREVVTRMLRYFQSEGYVKLTRGTIEVIDEDGLQALPRCWVGDTHKIIYDTLEEAELAAKVAAYDHHLDRPLKPYKCPYAPHYHLSSD
ncbi:winged helix-turn-helix domain-containing protein, partial [Candidatus Saccharibacteria bacterium]|nr:winged helix-turn-helix domain-containing protein [Candidatus Saccharibacteria bacterium]